MDPFFAANKSKYVGVLTQFGLVSPVLLIVVS